MTTLIYSHPACCDHDPGLGHPESAARLEAILAALEGPEFANLEWRDAPAAERGQIARIHPERYIDRVLHAIPEAGYAQLGIDTFVSPGSWEAALRAAGAVCAAVDAVACGDADNAFCMVRPPGHHAERENAMGFCIFNNVAIGALQAREVHHMSRVAVVDFDVHHGNGTQAVFWEDPDLFYASVHQAPLYPGTGAVQERGRCNNIINVPLAPMAGSLEFRRQIGERILPSLAKFEPHFILISAGFDGHESDPLADMRLHEDDYAWVTMELLAIARHASRGRLVSTLEGGYDLRALGASAAAHVSALVNG